MRQSEKVSKKKIGYTGNPTTAKSNTCIEQAKDISTMKKIKIQHVGNYIIE